MARTWAWVGLVAYVMIAVAPSATGRTVHDHDHGHGHGHSDAAAPGGGRQFPPDPQVDFRHLKLELNMPRPEERRFTAVETLTFAVPRRPVDSIELDAVDLTIMRVS